MIRHRLHLLLPFIKRLQAVSYAYDAAIRQLDGEPELPHFRYNCMCAIIGAASLLDRDPVALARLLADGRLAEYIDAAEGTIPLPLDDPTSVATRMEDVLREAADWMDREHDALERKLRNVLKDLRRTAADLRLEARQGGWRDTRRNARATLQLAEDWRRRRGLSEAPPGARKRSKKRSEC
ncbi:MAG: hypothetical protein M3451_09675 [Chloroflexota bacterium]|nr:hypothetical protein [Chloroflexota bacterium]